MENSNMVSTDSTVVSQGTDSGEGATAENSTPKRSVKELLAMIPNYSDVREMLVSLPADVFNAMVSDIRKTHRTETDTATAAGMKLFGPGIHEGASDLALVFVDGVDPVFADGTYHVVSRDSVKGRPGKDGKAGVTMLLRNIKTGKELTLNSREHSSIIQKCIVERAKNGTRQAK